MSGDDLGPVPGGGYLLENLHIPCHARDAVSTRRCRFGDFRIWAQFIRRAEKKKGRMSWKTNCEHLAEQNTIFTVQKEELAMLKCQIVELEAKI